MSFVGQIADLPMGPEGLTGTKNQATVRPGQLIEARNITYETGTLRKEGGAAKYNSVAIAGATNSVLAGHEWDHDGSTQRTIVITSNGDARRDDGAGTFSTTPLASGLVISNSNPQFVEGGFATARKLFLFTGQNRAQVLTGGATAMTSFPTAGAGGPADWEGSHPSFGANHEDRIFAGGNGSDPYRLYYTTPTNHEDATSAGSGTISVYPGEGQELVAAISFKGVLIAFKRPIGIYVVNTTGGGPSTWGVDRLTRNIGTVSANSVVQVEDDVLFMDNHGDMHLISAVQEFGDLKTSSISAAQEMDEFIREEFNLSGLAKVQGVYYAAKREAHFAVPGLGSTTNSLRFVVDFNRPGLPRFRWSDRDTPISLWLQRDSDGVPRLTLGNNTGFVLNLDQSTRANDGAGYTATFQIPHLDLSHLDVRLSTVRKEGKFLEIDAERKGNFNIQADIFWDSELHETVTFNTGASGGQLGSFVLGTSTLGSDSLVTLKRRITGGGRRFSVVFRNGGLNEDMSIARARLHFKLGNERIL